jgi:hypothetical protein
MITDRAIAELCVALYAYPDNPPMTWDHYDPGEYDGVCWALKRAGDTDVIILRGSTTQADWIHDAETWAAPETNPLYEHMGPVHYGFSCGMDRMWRDARLLTGKKVIVAGHSLGAGRACILTGLMIADGEPPIARVCFGEPRPAYAQLGEYIKSVPARSYRNAGAWGHDLVTDVPFTLPEFPFVHPAPLIDIDVPPDQEIVSRWSVFAGHHLPLYVRGLAAHPNTA